MNDEYLEIVDCLKEEKAKNFITRTKDNTSLKTNIEQVVRDLSWIETLEDAIPFIDTIVRNPRKFIVQEEEILPVEKTKKITQESIKHLAQNTSLIQAVDKKDGVKPLKLLNVFKEETTDLYENRFIYSLLVNVRTFLNDQQNKIDEALKSKYKKILDYNSVTRISGEKIEINLKMETEYLASNEEVLKDEVINERIKRIKEVFDDFFKTQFVKSITGATPVRSPIRKTNVILKDQNFKVAVNLWEFLEKYNVEESIKVVKIDKDEDVMNLNEKLKAASYLEYYATNNLSKRNKEEIQIKFSTPYLKSIIDSYVSEKQTNEREFKAMINKEFKLAKIRKEKEYLEIKEIFNKVINRHKENAKNALKFLK